MECYIELWKAKDSWTNLSKEERGNFLQKLGPHIQSMMESGVEVVNWGYNEDSTQRRADYDFFAIWKFPSKEAVQDFENIVDEAGWYNYFDQVNVSGEASTPQQVLGKLMEL